jgi:hypothetical protein
MAIDTAQKRSIVLFYGNPLNVLYPTGTVDALARGGVLGRYYEAPAAATGRNYWRRLGRKAIGGGY